MTEKKLNHRQAQWSLFLSRFDFHMVHQPGCHCRKPDALSRCVDHGKGDHDNENEVLLKPEYFKIAAMKRGHVTLTGEEGRLLVEIREVREFDESVVKAVAEMRKSGEKKLRGQKWEEEQGLVLYRGKVYVPKDGELCCRLVHAHHDTPWWLLEDAGVH